MIVTHSLHPLPAQVSCEAFSFRPWVPFPPHRLCQNSVSGPKELLLTGFAVCQACAEHLHPSSFT